MKTIPLISLSPGDKFQIPNCISTLKNGEVIRSSDGSIYVTISEFRNEKWTRENMYLSPSIAINYVKDWINEKSEKIIDNPPKIAENKEEIKNDPIKYKKVMNTNTENKNQG